MIRKASTPRLAAIPRRSLAAVGPVLLTLCSLLPGPAAPAVPDKPVRAAVAISADAEWETVRALFPKERYQRTPFGEFFIKEFALPDRTLRPVVIVHGGWGKTAAAASTQYIIDRWNPRILMNFGTCGGFNGAIRRGDVVLASKTVIYDITERMGDAEEAVKSYATEIDLGWLKGTLPMPVIKTVLVSADQDLDPDAIPRLRARYGAVAADWESGAIAFVARKNVKRLLILRGVTDLVGPEGSEAYGRLEVFKANAQTIMKKLFDALPAWLQLAER